MDQIILSDQLSLKVTCIIPAVTVGEIDALCQANDLTRSQLMRRCISAFLEQNNCHQLNRTERENEERNLGKGEMKPEKQVNVVVLGTAVERVVTLDDLISTGELYQIDLHTYGGIGSHEYNLSVDSEPQIAEKIRLGQLKRAGWDQE